MGLIVRTLSDQLVNLVRDRILSGSAAPNSPIRQDALAGELGISKIPLREALARLEEEGLVQSQANRGFFVRALSAAEVEEVYALRLKIEPETVVAAALRATDADHAIARDIHAARYEVTNEDGAGIGALNRAFHMALVRPSGQTITINLLERLQVLSERYIREHLEPLGRDEKQNADHTRMLEAWIARDLEPLKALTEAHIQKTLTDIRRQIATEEKEAAEA